MDVREKLVDILKQAPFEGKVLDEWWWEEKIKRIADHLISNGVTVQEWALQEEEYYVLRNKANSLAEASAEAEDFTLRFLKCCSKHHIKLVSIGKKTELIESAKNFPFSFSGSVFSDGIGSDGWPAIWGVVEEMGISDGCGNTGQHQVSCDAKLIDGVYEFKDKKWRKIG